MSSRYCCYIANEYGIKLAELIKLDPNLGNKSKYVLHYKNLQLYLSLGTKLTKTNKILKFKESDWLRKYIDSNTSKRKNAANSFERGFFKLMNNSVFGKTMESLRRRISIKLVNNAKDYMNI